jgi:hypothetical protein
MKRFVLAVVACLILVFPVVWSMTSLSRNLAEAHSKYSGNDEEVLLAYLQDETNSPSDRTRVAVWSLGEIKSRKALPVLKDMVNELLGEEHCKGAHQWRICQHEIRIAVHKIEAGNDKDRKN